MWWVGRDKEWEQEDVTKKGSNEVVEQILVEDAVEKWRVKR